MQPAIYSEKQLDQALHQALETRAEFRAWFLDHLRYGKDYPNLVRCRSDHPWGKVRLILPNRQTGALEPVDKEGETDVLAIFESITGKRLGVHIENKLASGSFTSYQAEMYAARAEHWVGRPKYASYHMWETVLLAPASFVLRNQTEARKFMSVIYHEQIARFISEFGTAAPSIAADDA